MNKQRGEQHDRHDRRYGSAEQRPIPPSAAKQPTRWTAPDIPVTTSTYDADMSAYKVPYIAPADVPDRAQLLAQETAEALIAIETQYQKAMGLYKEPEPQVDERLERIKALEAAFITAVRHLLLYQKKDYVKYLVDTIEEN
jgi:hypothetical protein